MFNLQCPIITDDIKCKMFNLQCPIITDDIKCLTSCNNQMVFNLKCPIITDNIKCFAISYYGALHAVTDGRCLTHNAPQ